MSTKTKIWLSLLLVAALIVSFGFGYSLGFVATPSGAAFDSVEQAWNIILNDYVEPDKLDVNQLSQAAIEGMLEALDDPYTTYLDSEAYQFSLDDLEGKFEGIGATVSMNEDDQIEIIAPLANSPAAEAGIQPGDIILGIDGESTAGMGLYEAILEIRGPEGTSVSLLILHADETEPVEIVIVRGVIELASVHLEMRGDIACITITEFNERTNAELAPVLEDIESAGASGIVLDLRSNPGGLLSAVINVASRFLGEGIAIVSIRDNKGNIENIKSNNQDITTGLPLIVLVDGYSASGSEVLAGALQDHGRALIAGTITYGKGSVNYLIQLVDGSGIYITAARWLTPDGRLIEGEGITPDIELEIGGDEAIQWAIDYLHSNK